VFEHSLHKSLPDTNLAKRLRNISETHTYNLYNYGCTGIFEKHKLLFSFQITLKLKIDEGLVSRAHVMASQATLAVVCLYALY